MHTKQNTLTFMQRIKDSALEIKSVKSLCGCAMLTALHVVISSVRIVISNLLEISFSYLAVGVCAMMYGPLLTGLAVVIADLLNYIVRPSGPFFPGFTINAFVSAFIYGCFLYKKEVTLPRTILCRLTVVIVINLILTPIWLNILYGNALFAMPRIIKNIVMFPIDTALLYITLKTASRISIHRNK